MDYRNYITIEPNKRGGKPCVRGLRITVYEVLEYLASEMTEAEILDDFPDLTREDLVISHSNRKGLMRKPPEPPDYPGNRGGGEHPDEAMSSKR